MRQLNNRTTISHSVIETQKFAQEIADQLEPGSVLALYGDLGSGKTTFTKALAQTLGVTKPVTSPTFILMRQYPLPHTSSLLFHLDLYRISSPEDIKSIDLEELIAEHSHIIVIEWPEKIEALLPNHTIKINFQTLSETDRSISVQNHQS